MSLEEGEYVVDEFNGKLLSDWLDTGKWSREQATLLFLDIDPDRAHGECFSTFSGQGEIRYEYYVDEDPRTIVQYGADEDDEPYYLSPAQEALLQTTKKLIRQIERKISFYDSAEPHEWIELGCKKEIPIPWLNWAIRTERYIQKHDREARPSPDLEKAGLPSPPGIVMDSPASADVARSESEPRPAATGPIFTMTRTAMIAQHIHKWPTIEQDMKNAHRNELHKAKAGAREWHEAKAMDWARAKGRLTSSYNPMLSLNNPLNSMFDIKPNVKHKLQG